MPKPPPSDLSAGDSARKAELLGKADFIGIQAYTLSVTIGELDDLIASLEWQGKRAQDFKQKRWGETRKKLDDWCKNLDQLARKLRDEAENY
jgi:uncharacterized protein YukE